MEWIVKSKELFGDKERIYLDKDQMETFVREKVVRIAISRLKATKGTVLDDETIMKEFNELMKYVDIEEVNVMDIGSGGKYPSNALSNFAPHPFVIDDVKCASMEGFLQGLKYSNADMQAHVCTLVGREAKFKGSKKSWRSRQTLYWKGKAIARDSDEYTELINRAYNEMAKNDGFRRALIASGDAVLEHRMGRKKKNETVLTRQEFCSILTRIRDEINRGER